MEFTHVSDKHQLTKWKAEWNRVHTKHNNSVFTAYSWVEHHLSQSKGGFVLIIHKGERLMCALPLSVCLLSQKTLSIKCVEHLCKAFTDYQEFLIDAELSIEDVARNLSDYLAQHFPKHVFKIDFPPQQSKTARLLELLGAYFDVQPSGVHYVFENNDPTQPIDRKLASDVTRRRRNLSKENRLEFTFSESVSDALLEQMLDLHCAYHGESSLNGKPSRREILKLLTSLGEQLICSTLRVDGQLAACAISFSQGRQLQYYAPAMDAKFRKQGVGQILLRQIQENLQQYGFERINFLRGEEAYKAKLSLSATLITPFVGVPTNMGKLNCILIRIWCARQNRQVQRHRLRFNSPLRKSLVDNYAIVLANGLNGLGALRILAREQINVVLICPNENDFSALSRLAKQTHILPMDQDWESRVLSLLEAVCNEIEQTIPIFTCSDRAANFVESYKHQLPSNIRSLHSSGELNQILNDKQSELAFASEHGIPIPKSVWRISDQRPFDSLQLPIIVKPKDYSGYTVLAAKNAIMSSSEELNDFYSRFAEQLDQFVAQELIDGPDENLWVCNATFDQNHQMVCAFSFRRMGTAPSHFGVTSMAISEHNERIKTLVEKLGQSCKYVGPGMWEFKYCPKTQQYLYIETNPRLGMCNWFDARCNVNNVLATYYLAKGQSVNKLGWLQTTGIYYANALGDLTARLEDKEPLSSILNRLLLVMQGTVVWSTWTPQDKRVTYIIVANQLRDIIVRVVSRVFMSLTGLFKSRS